MVIDAHPPDLHGDEAGSHPLQGTLAPRVGQAKEQDCREHERFHESVDGYLSESDGPGVQEDRLYIEHDEDDRKDVVAGVKLNPGSSLGGNTAFVCLRLDDV